MKEFLIKNLWAILLIIGGVALNGTVMYLNSIHSMKGEAEKAILQLEIRKQEAYEEADPDSKNSLARKMITKEAKDMLKNLESK